MRGSRPPRRIVANIFHANTLGGTKTPRIPRCGTIVPGQRSGHYCFAPRNDYDARHGAELRSSKRRLFFTPFSGWCRDSDSWAKLNHRANLQLLAENRLHGPTSQAASLPGAAENGFHQERARREGPAGGFGLNISLSVPLVGCGTLCGSTSTIGTILKRAAGMGTPRECVGSGDSATIKPRNAFGAIGVVGLRVLMGK